MKNIFLLFSCSFQFAAAQYIPARTKTTFNSFIEKPSIIWAVYANDTASFPLLAEKLFQKFNTGKIKGFEAVENGLAEEDHLQVKTVKDIERILIPAREPIYDNSGNEIKDDNAKTVADAFKKSVLEFYQILYVEAGRLNSFISRFSVKTQIVSPAGDTLGYAELASLSINKKYDQAKDKKAKLTYLGETKLMLNADSLPRYDRLKEIHGRNIIETIWPGVMTGKTSIYSGPEQKILTVADLLTGKYPGSEVIMIPVYDSLGNPMGMRPMGKELSARDFDKITLTEKWYYDEKKNIIICKIPEAVLYKKTVSKDEEPQFFRLVF